MPHARPQQRKKAPKRVLALPDLEHAKWAVLSSLTSRTSTHSFSVRPNSNASDLCCWICTAGSRWPTASMRNIFSDSLIDR